MCERSVGLDFREEPIAGMAEGSKGGCPPTDPDANACIVSPVKPAVTWAMQYSVGIGCPAIAWYALLACVTATVLYACSERVCHTRYVSTPMFSPVSICIRNTLYDTDFGDDAIRSYVAGTRKVPCATKRSPKALYHICRSGALTACAYCSLVFRWLCAWTIAKCLSLIREVATWNWIPYPKYSTMASLGMYSLMRILCTVARNANSNVVYNVTDIVVSIFFSQSF